MRQKLIGTVLAAVAVASGLAVIGAGSGAAAKTASCPVNALKRASKPVQITFWHSMAQDNEKTLQGLTDQFNASQSDVKVSLVNQISYDDTLTKFRAGLSSGDLPDLVQLQETDQQLMIDSQRIVPSGACAKADGYSFSDFLPRVVSYFTVSGQMYAMPFNVSGPVLMYNKKAFAAAGLDPDKPPTTLGEVRIASEKLRAAGVVTGAPFGLKVESGYVEHWLGLSGKLFVDNSNGRTKRATKSVLNSPTGKRIFSWLSGMVNDKLAVTNPYIGPGIYDNLLGIGNGSQAMTIDTSATLGTISTLLSSGAYPNVELGVAPMPGLVTGKGGVLVSGGSLYIVKGSSPAKQAAAWEYAKFLDAPDSQTKWAVGTGYVPIRKSSADSAAMKAFWAAQPIYQVAYDQLAKGPVNAATAGSVIGNYAEVRQAVRDGESSMFIGGTSPAAALAATTSEATAQIQDYNERLGVS